MIDLLLADAIALSPASSPVFEDDASWSCIDNGNRVCGPNNEQGMPAGRYDEGGVLVDPWPVA
jgi:hypothetical protein